MLLGDELWERGRWEGLCSFEAELCVSHDRGILVEKIPKTRVMVEQARVQADLMKEGGNPSERFTSARSAHFVVWHLCLRKMSDAVLPSTLVRRPLALVRSSLPRRASLTGSLLRSRTFCNCLGWCFTFTFSTFLSKYLVRFCSIAQMLWPGIKFVAGRQAAF